jgi:carbonic anhydrase/acetyltransferase-like protein (isoleucine patch superfamily)
MEWNRYLNEQPNIDPTAFVADSADLIGAVTVRKDASIWYQVVIRADDEPVTIGEGSNVQDGTIIHIDPGCPTVIGDFVTIGHRAIVHGAQIGDHVMISMGAIVLSGARIGEYSIIGAGALVTERMEVPRHSLVVGIPGRVIKTVSEEQIARIRQTTQGYIERGRIYREWRKG